ncbi:MAG: hypothetical protein WCE57_14405 [Salegentibacter sp.]
MKLLKLFSLLALLMIFACNNNQKESDMTTAEADMWNPDEGMKDWIDSWNNNDAQGLKDVTADDAVLLMDGTEVSSDSIDAWIDNNSAVMKDLKSKTLVENSSDNIAYQSGTYNHNLNNNDSIHYAGSYTVIWEKMEGNSSDTTQHNMWKIKLMDIATEHQDSTAMQNE